ncbi:MAG: hypothetical protein IJ268_13865, partial [Proteobacteria bacterium]|nr:hypothetical protein [Pseudomonadota bacterium]
QLPALSDETARTVLKEILEGAQELKQAGIITESAASEIAKGIPGTVRQSTAHTEAVTSIATNRSHLLGSMASRIESSVSRLVRDFVKSGANASGIETFVTDIRQMLSTGNEATGSAVFQPQAASVIEAICNRLDEFAEAAASSVSTYGYDDIATEGTFVSVSEPGASEVESVQSAKTLRTIQDRLQNEIRAAQAKAEAEFKSALEAQKAVNAAASQSGLKLLAETTGDFSPEQIRALLPMVGEEQKQTLEATAKLLEQRQSQLNAFQKQMSVVENTLKLSSELRKAAAGSNTVRMDDIRVNTEYLSSLGSSMASYARMRNSAQNIQFARTASLIQPESRMDKMLSLIKPVESKLSTVAGTPHAANAAFQQLSSTEVMIGYDELVPSSLEWLKSISPEQLKAVSAGQISSLSAEQLKAVSAGQIGSLSAEQRYPVSVNADLSVMLGTRKSFALHAADIANGRTEGFKALADSIQKLASESSRTAVVSSYQTTEDGDRIKVSMTLKPQGGARNGFELRQNTGMAYKPAALRNEAAAPEIGASLNIQNASVRSALSSVDSFVPVSAGANIGTIQSAAQGRDAVRMTLSKLGATFTETPAMDMSDRFRLTIGGVDFDMSSSSFVQMLAKPAISSASVSAPSLVNADNILFSGYATLLNEHGGQHTLKSLRQAYVDSVARAGQLSAHSEVGFSTQSFANVLGISPEFVAPKA